MLPLSKQEGKCADYRIYRMSKCYSLRTPCCNRKKNLLYVVRLWLLGPLRFLSQQKWGHGAASISFFGNKLPLYGYIPFLIWSGPTLFISSPILFIDPSDLPCMGILSPVTCFFLIFLLLLDISSHAALYM